MGRLADVEIFVAVIDEGGFTAAAAALGLSKSFVSKRVRALEDHVGAPLLTRNTRHVAPTPLGEAFGARCRAALELLDGAEALAAREVDEPRGTVRISLPQSFGLRYLARPLAELLTRHPELVVDATYTDRKVDLIDEGYDLAVRIGSLDDSDLVARRLASSEMLVLASPAYLAERPPIGSLHELHDHALLAYTLARDPQRITLPGPDGPVTFAARGRVRADSGDALVQAARAGLGIGVFPAWMVPDEVAAGALVPAVPGLPPIAQGVWALYPRHRHLVPKVARCVEHLAAALSPAPWRTGDNRTA